MQTNDNQAFHEKHFYFKLALTFLINSVPLFKYFVSDMSIHILYSPILCRGDAHLPS